MKIAPVLHDNARKSRLRHFTILFILFITIYDFVIIFVLLLLNFFFVDWFLRSFMIFIFIFLYAKLVNILILIIKEFINTIQISGYLKLFLDTIKKIIWNFTKGNSRLLISTLFYFLLYTLFYLFIFVWNFRSRSITE